MRRHRQEMGPLTEINVTNLLDTAFVLLMAFMVVAPTIQHGLEVDLPEVKEAPAIDDPANKAKTYIITIKKKANEAASNQIIIDDELVDLKVLKKRLEENKSKHPNMAIVLEVDKTVPFQTFAQAMGVIKEAKIDNIGISTDTQEAEK